MRRTSALIFVVPLWLSLSACVGNGSLTQDSRSLIDLRDIIVSPAEYQDKKVEFVALVRDEGNFYRAHVPSKMRSGSFGCHQHGENTDDRFYPFEHNFPLSIHFAGMTLRGKSFM